MIMVWNPFCLQEALHMYHSSWLADTTCNLTFHLSCVGSTKHWAIYFVFFMCAISLILFFMWVIWSFWWGGSIRVLFWLLLGSKGHVRTFSKKKRLPHSEVIQVHRVHVHQYYSRVQWVLDYPNSLVSLKSQHCTDNRIIRIIERFIKSYCIT